jgi:integrase
LSSNEVVATRVVPLTFHQLRHTAAAFMIHDGAARFRSRDAWVHEDIRTTFNTYGHLFSSREEELVAALERRQKATQKRSVDSLSTVSTIGAG